jgi:hypothetical protein
MSFAHIAWPTKIETAKIAPLNSMFARRTLRAFPGSTLKPGNNCMVGNAVRARRRRDGLPFAITLLFFFAAFLSLRVIFWPDRMAYRATVASAVAAEASLGRGPASHRLNGVYRVLGGEDLKGED